MRDNIIVRARDIRKSFGDLEILKGIDLNIYDGEIIAIVGASGSGKTTLLQILGTLDNAYTGTVEIDGIQTQTLKGNALSDFRNKKIGFVFQAHQLLPEFTALENVALPALIAGDSKKTAFTKAQEQLAKLGMGERLHHKPNQLSGGERQRVAVARALINDPLVILADEPTGALDSDNRNTLHHLFRELNQKEQRTFIIVSHDAQIETIAHRVLHLKDGIIDERHE